MRRPAEPQIAQCAAGGVLGIAPAVLERWAESGLIPARGLARVRPQRFTRFPPLVEQELPVIPVEMLE